MSSPLLNGLPYFLGTGYFADGTAAAPSMTFASAPGLGFYKYSAGIIGVAGPGGVVGLLMEPGAGRLYGYDGVSYITMPAAGSITLTANGANQNITLTPSGTGGVGIGTTAGSGTKLVVGGGGLFTGGSSDPGDGTPPGIRLSYNAGVGLIQAGQTGVGFTPLSLNTNGGNVLFGTTTDSSNGRIQLATHTAYAGGVGFGTDYTLHRTADPFLAIAHVGGTTPGLNFLAGSTAKGRLEVAGDSVYLSTLSAAGILYFRSGNAATALTLDSAQNAFFAATLYVAAGSNLAFNTRSLLQSPVDGTLIAAAAGGAALTAFNFGAAGSATSAGIFRKNTTAIADNTATACLTITIPNAAHSACLRVTLCGYLGAGDAIGANQAAGRAVYGIILTRTAGKNAVASISANDENAVCAVAGATATCTVIAVISAVAGAVGASNSFTVNVTITRSAGASTNHVCQVLADIINANATGITLS